MSTDSTALTPIASVSPVTGPAAYRKFFAHLTASGLGLLLAARQDGISPVETGQLALLLAGSAMVYNTRNGGGLITGYAKAILAWAITVLTAVVPLLSGGWTELADSVPVILTAALGALGVGVVPNAGTSSLNDAVHSVLEELQALHGKVDRVEAVQIGQQVASSSRPAIPTGQRHDTGRGLIVPAGVSATVSTTSATSGSSLPVSRATQPAALTPDSEVLTTGMFDAVAQAAAPLKLER